MIINYYAHEFFRVQFGDINIAVNPIAKGHGSSFRFGADIALLGSRNDSNFNGADTASFGGKTPFIIDSPGAYETHGVIVNGFQNEKIDTGKPAYYTAFTFLLEGMSLCFLTNQKSRQLEPNIEEGLSAIDVLFVPIGGGDVLEPAEAYKLSVSLEPRIIIPMHYEPKSSALKTFLKEGGVEDTKPLEKLTLKPKDLAGKEGTIIVLGQQAVI